MDNNAEIKKDDKPPIINPFVYDKFLPEIVVEKQNLTVSDKKSTYIKCTGHTFQEAYDNFLKVKKEVRL